MQASEKIYKAAEEAVKILAKEHTPEVYDKAEHNGRWLASLLREAVRKIEGTLGDDVGRAWDAAWVLVEDFHERRSKEDVIWELKHVKKLVKLMNVFRSSGQEVRCRGVQARFTRSETIGAGEGGRV